MAEIVSFDDFKKADLRVGKIISAEEVPGSEKLVKLIVDIGSGTRQIIAGIRKSYPPEELVGRSVVVVANLAPRMFTLRSDSGQVGLESQGMLLAASDEPSLLSPDRDVPPGSEVR